MATPKRQCCKARWLRYGVIEHCGTMTRAKDGICPGHKHVRPLEVQTREWRSAIHDVDVMMGKKR